ncbi:MAG TPA: metallophosphoesterase [Polyangiaceae bacterium]|nr:metallophosphoesterase [Polyangiaceae bacterium]
MRGELQGTDGNGTPRLIRVAAVGDVHVGVDSSAFTPEQVADLPECADLLLLAGDLTQHGYAREAARLADELARVPIPVVAVLGNHDYHQGEQAEIRAELERAGATVLEGERFVQTIAGICVGVAGVKGFGGGFVGACGSEFGEEEMKAFIRHSRLRAESLQTALAGLECELKIALLHYAPVPGTLLGEKPEIYPFLGSYFLGEAVDGAHCAAAFHGHAHLGTERAVTAAGVPVRNVARPVIRRAYKIYTLSAGVALDEAAQPGSGELAARVRKAS